ncbi:MAG TPA: MFS transporter, partial [Ktedonobacteraceae bacterium]|nr:MFS transporter [Ktedonobacteraceae bacterium]
MVYQVEVAKLNPLQLVLVGTALETASFLSQVPTGIFADVYSRRLSIIIGVFLSGAGFILQGSFPRFDIILLSQIGWGVGSSFISGAEEAWIAEEVGEEKVGKVFLRGAQVGQFGALLGAAISVALASIRVNLPIVLGGGLILLLGVYLLLFMPEHSFHKTSQTAQRERPTWKMMSRTMFESGRLVRGSPLLITLLCLAAFYGMASEGFDRLWTAHLLLDITLPALGPLNSVVWFGIIRGGVMIFSIIVVEGIRRFIDTSRHKTVSRLLFIINTLQIISMVIFGLAGNFTLALAAYWSASILRETNQPIYMAWLAQNIDAKVRATVISLSGQLDAIGQIAGGPIIGVIGTLVSIRAALVSAAALLSPTLLLFVRADSQGKKVEVDIAE